MGLQMRGVDHQAVRGACWPRQFAEDRIEHSRAAPADEAVVQRVVRSIAFGRIFPLKAVPNDRDDSTDHPQIIHPRNAVGNRKIGFDSIQLLLGQQNQLTQGHLQPE